MAKLQLASRPVISFDHYSVEVLRGLESAMDAPLIIEYKDMDGFTMRGRLVTAYHSLQGNQCVSIDNFCNTIYANQVTGHYFED